MDVIPAGSVGIRAVPDPRSKQSGTNYWMRDNAGRKQLRDAWNDERFDWTAPFHTVVTIPRGMGRQSVIDVHEKRGWILQTFMMVEMGNHLMTFIPGGSAITGPLSSSPKMCPTCGTARRDFCANRCIDQPDPWHTGLSSALPFETSAALPPAPPRETPASGATPPRPDGE